MRAQDIVSALVVTVTTLRPRVVTANVSAGAR